MKQELSQVIETIQDVCEERGLKCSDDSILNSATILFKSMSTSINNNSKDNPGVDVTNLMSNKQKNVLIKFGYKGNMNLSKNEATAILNTYFKKFEKKEVSDAG